MAKTLKDMTKAELIEHLAALEAERAKEKSGSGAVDKPIVHYIN